MTVINYIKNERERLRAKHLGEMSLCFGGEEYVTVERSAREILREIDNLPGLNVRERFARASVEDSIV